MHCTNFNIDDLPAESNQYKTEQKAREIAHMGRVQTHEYKDTPHRKICRTCKKNKLAKNFDLNTWSKDGLRLDCIECVKENKK